MKEVEECGEVCVCVCVCVCLLSRVGLWDVLEVVKCTYSIA